MYEEAEKQIRKGLSPAARWIIGIACAAFGLAMFLVEQPADTAVYRHAFGIFFLLISGACFTWGRVRQFAGSLIGCGLLFLSGWYLYSQIMEGPLQSGSRSEPSVWNAVLFFVAFGLPGGTYAYKAKFGWRRSKKTREDRV